MKYINAMEISSWITHRFWMGFNSFVLLFLAVNIATIGVETDSGLPFWLALGYMIYMSVYLSKTILLKVYVLLGIGLFGALFYAVGLITGFVGPLLRPLAVTQIVLSLILSAGAFAHLTSKR